MRAVDRHQRREEQPFRVLEIVVEDVPDVFGREPHGLQIVRRRTHEQHRGASLGVKRIVVGIGVREMEVAGADPTAGDEDFALDDVAAFRAGVMVRRIRRPWSGPDQERCHAGVAVHGAAP